MKRQVIETKRVLKDLTQEEAAIAIGISRSFYNQIENGTRDPSVKVAYKIAMFYDLTLDDIFLPNLTASHNTTSSQLPAGAGQLNPIAPRRRTKQ